MSYIIVQTTLNNKKDAKKMAQVLLKSKLCVCVQIHKSTSLYTWKNEICEDKEFILNIKTKKEKYKKIQSKIKELHSYDLPEIIAINIDNMSAEYKEFIGENIQ